jgi:hypothetical protein
LEDWLMLAFYIVLIEIARKNKLKIIISLFKLFLF